MTSTIGMRSRPLFAVAIVLSVASHGLAGDHWLSRPLTIVPPGNQGVRQIVNTPESLTDAVGPRSGVSIGPIDLVVSLESDPAGDNNRNTLDDRTPYEQIFEHFADAVYEATNGAHYVRTIRVFPNGEFSRSADVVWQSAPMRPSANTAGWGVAGQHIYMADTFDVGVQLDALDVANRRSAGYVLAHEFCHYAYGLYDEYRGQADPESGELNPRQPRASDVPIVPSIMANPWLAAQQNDFRHLNFSIANASPIGDFNDTQHTAQHRVYSASCWETLVRSASEDPRSRSLWARPRRTQWSDLVFKAPAGEAGWTADLPDPAARGALNVVWMLDGIIYELVIDHSGSMAGDKIEKAKTAAQFLVDTIPTGASVGVVEFDASQVVTHPILAMNSDADRNSVKAAIAGINAGGATDIEGAALFGLDQLNAVAEEAGKVVFLLTDGNTTVPSVDPQVVISDFQVAGVPLFTFGYGGDADEVLLRELAEQTGGRYYFSPITLADITAVFADANRHASGGGNIVSGDSISTPGSAFVRNFPVDDSVGTVIVTLTYTGAASDAVVELRQPTGAIVVATAIEESADETQVRYRIENPLVGTWNLQVMSGNGAALPFKYDVSFDTADNSFGYTLTVQNLTGLVVKYPEPMLLTAVLKKARPIAGASVTATIKRPNGGSFSIPFRDDGVAPDAMANDGQYSAIYTPPGDPSNNGEYEVRVTMVNNGNAVFTSSGLQIPTPDGDDVVVADQPVNVDFERTAVRRIVMTGLKTDDHGNTADEATLIIADNTDTPAQINYAGDIDMFKFQVPVSQRRVALRISDLALGMRPRLRVMHLNGQVIGDTHLASIADGDVGEHLRVPVDSGAGEFLFAEVTHVNGIGFGSYSISVGTPMPGELEVLSNNDRDGDGVINELDGCPDNPAKVVPGVCGCGLNDVGDRDGDGVLDCVDACPDMAADPNGSATGCPSSVEAEQPENPGTPEPESTSPVVQSAECGCGAGTVPLAPLGLIGFLGLRTRMRKRRSHRRMV